MKNLRFLALAASLCALALNFSSCSKDDEPTNVFEFPELETTNLKDRMYSGFIQGLQSEARLNLRFISDQEVRLNYIYNSAINNSRGFIPLKYELDAKTRELKLIMLEKSAYENMGPTQKVVIIGLKENAKQIPIIKIVRAKLGLGLKECKALVDNLSEDHPIVFDNEGKGFKPSVAKAFAKELEDAGAIVMFVPLEQMRESSRLKKPIFEIPVDYEVAQEFVSKVQSLEVSRGLKEIFFKGSFPGSNKVETVILGIQYL